MERTKWWWRLRVSGQKVTPQELALRRPPWQIVDVPFGATVFTTPWALWVDKSGMYWLNGNYPAYANRNGTVQLKLTATPYGFIVDGPLHEVGDGVFIGGPPFRRSNPPACRASLVTQRGGLDERGN